MTDTANFYQLLKAHFPFETTQKQEQSLRLLSDFIVGASGQNIFVLRGFAGTGKTTIIGTLVKQLWKVKRSAVLLAPTGRAAKVITNYSGAEAQTIHRKIYSPRSSKSGPVKFVLGVNKHKKTLFVVDEASMISNIPASSSIFGSGALLDDLVQYVYSGHQCQLLLIGDTAQLPPVKLDLSPALDVKHLELQYNRPIIEVELDEVVRQAQDSGILHNATAIREQLSAALSPSFAFNIDNYADVTRLIDGYEIMDAINDAYGTLGHEEVALIVRSNKRANNYNLQIRSRILFQENELAAGDYLMVVKNNYFWLKPSSEAGFIANGDIVEVLEVFKIVELYGFRFAEVKVQMVDYPRMRPFETVVMLDTLKLETPALPYEQSNALYQAVLEDHADETSNYRKFMKVRSSPYLNALQIKFSYAITCHKSQGGQWHTVFVEQPYLKEGPNRAYYRWLYTAVTRAREKLYLIGFQDTFFE